MSSSVYASGVLIQKDGLILVVKRKDSELIGFPGGKLEEDELASFAAIRECFEETGYVVFVYPPSAYAGVDDRGNVTKIYRAEIVCHSDKEISFEEGGYTWVKPELLVSHSPWPEYNKSVLEHFGISWST